MTRRPDVAISVSTRFRAIAMFGLILPSILIPRDEG
jgi:hypothetical protein